MEEESARAVTGLLPGSPLCADDGYASVGQGKYYNRPDARINSLTRSGCPDQRCEGGPLYRRGSSRRRLLSATMEAMGISREENASVSCGKPQQHHDGINLVFTQHHTSEKDKAK